MSMIEKAPPGFEQEWLTSSKFRMQVRETRACNCIGPQNGDPVCPCQMSEYMRRKMADAALELMMRGKPRIRVPAISRPMA